MSNRRHLILITLLALLILSGCSAMPSDKDRGSTEAPSSPSMPAPAPSAPGREIADDGGRAEPGDLDAAVQKIIRNSDITLESPHTEEALETIQRWVNEMGGYISDVNLQKIGDQGEARIYMTARIPEGDFDTFSTRLQELGVITQSRTWTTDVTEEYIDLQAQLTNLRSEEEALRAILASATTVEDMLAVRSHLNDVRSRIDSISGRLRYLENRVSFSTFQITILPEGIATTAIRVTGFQNFGSNVVRALIRGSNWILNVLANSLLFLAAAAPSLALVLIVALIGWFIFRRIRG